MNNTKETLIAAAAKIFRTKGLEAATITDITRKARLGHGTFYLYYKTKNAVIADIAAQEAARIEARLRAQLDPAHPLDAQLARLVHTFYDYVRHNRALYTLIFTGLAQNNTLTHWDALYRPIYQLFEQLLQPHKERGTLREDTDLAHTAKFIAGLIEFSAQQDHLYATRTDNESHRSQQQLVTFIINAITHPSPANAQRTGTD